MMLCLYACNISQDRNDSHQSGGKIETEVQQQEDRSRRSATVSAELDMKSLIEDEDQNARKQIFQANDPHTGGSRRKNIGYKAENIASHRKQHGKRALSVSALVLEMRRYRLQGISKQGQKAEIKDRVVLEKTLESPLERKEIKPVHAKGNQS